MVKRLFGLSKQSSKKSSSSANPTATRNQETELTELNESIANVELTSQRETASQHDDDDVGETEDFASTKLSSSVFSKSRMTYETGNSSNRASSHKDQTGKTIFGDVGTPLRVLGIDKMNLLNPVLESMNEGGFANDQVPSVSDTQTTPIVKTHSVEFIQKELDILESNLIDLMDDVHQNVTNISKAVIQAIEFFKDFSMNVENTVPTFTFTFSNNASIRNITKIVLHFIDNLLISEGFINSRSILLRRYVYFVKQLKINVTTDNEPEFSQLLPHMTNFCITEQFNIPNMNKIEKIMDQLIKSDSAVISDQEGAFIAPILRGLSPNSSILTVMFGIPNVQQEHFEMVKVLYSLFPDVHFYCGKDSIKACADVLSPTKEKLDNSKVQDNLTKEGLVPSQSYQFTPPYRITKTPFSPPISMSLSSMGNSKFTGTLGGYLFPQIGNDSKLSQFAGSSFAITCAHVVLSDSRDYPHIATPSSVLQFSYKEMLKNEAKRYPKGSNEQSAFLQEAKKVEDNMEWQNTKKFGQVVWGERSIINQRLSDFAIIKVNPEYKCRNTLGSDLPSIPDPTLRFQNTVVKKKVLKLKPGMEVFKIGASTGYTTGKVNAAKLVYWADGKLQSGEFVVSSPVPLFANSGDSGAWILTKLEDHVGLGVVGMLHSYDGEQKQFGLFTPIGDILERLNVVTGIQWDIDNPI
ncbi:hypothetical protein NCAS_0I02780 [Naumovozyma castellii]|uniref:SPS-sensor serine protease component SSY5 n=1 Tax=Naumovozyma castellii TaxID=27288 RepID=G0VKB2_NAUCA|nr:hypothetical protein NCAS_0I02780 [Naumovozyma castellii CBS 4309]CCC71946.1 hypothetical protein NCAS_0I02780 [Naumovozyma castellii CBS 4309]